MRHRNQGVIAAIVLTALAGSAPASAQGFFDFFGFGRRPSPPPQVQPYAEPSFGEDAPVRRRVESAPSATFCVRLCDGHYFPVQRVSGNAAETCSAFCPAAKTKVFSGSGIDNAVSNDGKRYADLDNAFAYRDKVVDGCTCNGRNAFGLARVNVANDPTLREGDIVATGSGMAVYRGKQRGVAQFTPIDKSKVSSEMKSRLANMKVQPEFNGEDRSGSETTGAPAAGERQERRTQR